MSNNIGVKLNCWFAVTEMVWFWCQPLDQFPCNVQIPDSVEFAENVKVKLSAV